MNYEGMVLASRVERWDVGLDMIGGREESYLIQVTEYTVSNKIAFEPAFA